MEQEVRVLEISKGRLWLGWILSVGPALLLILDGVMKLVKPETVVKGTMALGYPESVIVPLGVILLVCTALYVLPRTSALGALLLTGYLGGAVASHVRAGQNGQALAPFVFGIVLWVGLVLRRPELRPILPVRG